MKPFIVLDDNEEILHIVNQFLTFIKKEIHVSLGRG